MSQSINIFPFPLFCTAAAAAVGQSQNGKFETVADLEIRAGSATRRPKSRRQKLDVKHVIAAVTLEDELGTLCCVSPFQPTVQTAVED